MGCSGPREKLEDQMMIMKLERMEVQMEREKQLKKLSEIDGRKIQKNNIPDYIDPAFAREKKIYEEDNNNAKVTGGKNNKNKKERDKKEKDKKNEKKKRKA